MVAGLFSAFSWHCFGICFELLLLFSFFFVFPCCLVPQRKLWVSQAFQMQFVLFLRQVWPGWLVCLCGMFCQVWKYCGWFSSWLPFWWHVNRHCGDMIFKFRTALKDCGSGRYLSASLSLENMAVASMVDMAVWTGSTDGGDSAHSWKYKVISFCSVSDHRRCWWCGSKVGIIVCDCVSVIAIVLLVVNLWICTVLFLDRLFRLFGFFNEIGWWVSKCGCKSSFVDNWGFRIVRSLESIWVYVRSNGDGSGKGFWVEGKGWAEVFVKVGIVGDYNVLGLFRRVNQPIGWFFWESNKDTTGCIEVVVCRQSTCCRKLVHNVWSRLGIQIRRSNQGLVFCHSCIGRVLLGFHLGLRHSWLGKNWQYGWHKHVHDGGRHCQVGQYSGGCLLYCGLSTIWLQKYHSSLDALGWLLQV